MPRRLQERCNKEESIREFRIAARQRAADARVLVNEGRRTAAVYLLGYVAEMTLKAAYFRLLGYTETQKISLPDLRQAKKDASTLHVNWPGHSLHNIGAWAELIVVTRLSIQRPYPSAIGSRVIANAFQVYKYWRETLRYKMNTASAYELQQVESATNWLLTNYGRL